MYGRGADGHDELESVVFIVYRFLHHRGEVTGVRCYRQGLPERMKTTLKWRLQDAVLWPVDADRRGGLGGKVGEAEMLWFYGNPSPELRPWIVMSRWGPPRRPGTHGGKAGYPSDAQDQNKEDGARGKGGGGLSSLESPLEFVSLYGM
jgi:hypothetical protein